MKVSSIFKFFQYLFALKSSFADELVVSTQYGDVEGFVIDNGNVNAWFGIPFAAPPVGDLRFKRPVPPAAWDDVLVAQEQPDACFQFNDTFFEDFSGTNKWNPVQPVSEDCLYLNVYTPNLDDKNERLPVMVWIHGGGYKRGSMSLPMFDPEELVKQGDIVIVHIQYRVGSLGFLYLGPESSATGNQGLYDQAMALQWVTDNIEGFGGDPDQMTIFGESAAANSVSIHLVSPVTQNLFNNAIFQSAGLFAPWVPLPVEKQQLISETLSNLSGCQVEDDVELTLECLQGIEDPALIRALEYEAGGKYPFEPIVDGEIFPAHPMQIFQSPQDYFIMDHNIMAGSNGNEGFWFLMYAFPDLMPNEELTEKEMSIPKYVFKLYVNGIFSQLPENLQELIIAQYDVLPDKPTKYFEILDKMVSDVNFVCPAEQTAKAFSLYGNNVYKFFYNHRSSIDPFPAYTKVKHGDGLLFVFGDPLKHPEMYLEEEVDLSEQLTLYWTNFVRYGDPNNPDDDRLLEWPTYNEDSDYSYLHIEDASTFINTDTDNFINICKFWSEDFFKIVAGG